MKNYDHKKIEKKWQEEWDKKKFYSAQTIKKKKFYGLIEFPYPSGAGMHVGHIRSNTAMDIITRKRRMEGYNVLYPIGWDAFGLPTENYAIKTGIQPEKVTKQNTDTFRTQLKALGFGFDWSREINTTDPSYYKWTQWIFLQFFKKGLAYKAKININWCPKDKIGLANEEVIDGKCERCGTVCEKREKEQWMLAITEYADRLDKDLDTVDYLEKIKIQQRNWIGKSEGSEIDFPIKDSKDKIKVFTTRADTLFGAFAVILSPEHELVGKLKSQIKNWDEVEKYVISAKNKTEIERTGEDKDKTGVELKGVTAINPANQEEIPVWIADFILVQYGTGAVFADMHDERDFAFAKKYNLPMKSVLEPVFTDELKEGIPLIERNAIHAIVKHWAEDKYLVLFWKKANWITFVTGGVEKGEDPKQSAVREIQEETGYLNPRFKKELPRSHSIFYHIPKKENRFVHFSSFYFELEDGEHKELTDEEKNNHEIKWLSPEEIEKILKIEGMLHDWGIFRGKEQTYTGEGILTNSGSFNGLTSAEARKEITKAVGGKIVTKYKLRDWVFSRQRYWGEPIPVVHCDNCGIVPVPDKDLPLKLPKVKNYQPTDSGESPLANISKWVNTKCPKCKGKAKRETDTMPNWAGSSWYYLRYADPKNKREFASKKNLKYFTPVDWYNGGMEHTTLHLLYSRFWHKFLYDLKLVPTSEPYMKRTSQGMILAEDGSKISKSKGNGIDPMDIIKIYGADTLRLHEMFLGPFDQAVPWNSDTIIGSRRFIEKIWRIGEKILKQKNFSGFTLPKVLGGAHTIQNSSVSRLLHKTIKKVTVDIEAMRFNTAISAMMILATEMEKSEYVNIEDYKKFVQILAPFTPHVAEELWSMFGEKKSISFSTWPKWDEALIKDDEIKIAVQINGKVRAEILVQASAEENIIKDKALTNEAVLKYISGKIPQRVIYVKGRLINIVL